MRRHRDELEQTSASSSNGSFLYSTVGASIFSEDMVTALDMQPLQRSRALPNAPRTFFLLWKLGWLSCIVCFFPFLDVKAVPGGARLWSRFGVIERNVAAADVVSRRLRGGRNCYGMCTTCNIFLCKCTQYDYGRDAQALWPDMCGGT